jgi:hypothetical protein
VKRATLLGERVGIGWPLSPDDLANLGIETMESITITIETGNAAYDDNAGIDLLRPFYGAAMNDAMLRRHLSAICEAIPIAQHLASLSKRGSMNQ